jgi:hypothetical protein
MTKELLSTEKNIKIRENAPQFNERNMINFGADEFRREALCQ